MKKSKVTKSEAWAGGKPNDYGGVKYNIEFENGDKGVQTSQPDKQFKVGQEVEYELTPSKWSTGKDYNKITRPKRVFGGGVSEDKFYEGLVQVLVIAKVITADQTESAKKKLKQILESK